MAARGKEGDGIHVEGTRPQILLGSRSSVTTCFLWVSETSFAALGLGDGMASLSYLFLGASPSLPALLTLSTSLYNVSSLNSPSIERAIQLLPVFRPHVTRLAVSFYGTEIKFCSPLNLHSIEHEVCGKLYRDGEGRKG